MSPNPNFYVRPEFVKRGHWVNWNYNRFIGGQITVHKDQVDILNIFLGIFLAGVAAAFWKLLGYLIFWIRHTTTRNVPSRRDGLYHQQQAILRNSGNPLDVSMMFWEIFIAWRRAATRVGRRVWLIILVSTFTFLLFVVASPFILAYPFLDNVGDEVLLQSPNCGFWVASISDNDITGTTDLTNRTREAVSYVDNCYNTKVPSSQCDNFLPKRRLPMLNATIAECQFEKNLCLSDDRVPAYRMETEALDSHKDFGINSPLSGRVTLRRVTTCSPLNVADFTKVTRGDLPEEEITGVYYGETISYKSTYRVSNYKVKSEPHYTLKAFWHKEQNGTSYSSIFDPIPELRQTNADLTVILLNNNLIPVKGQDGPCKDPFFSATNTSREIADGFYMPDHPITAIGCTDQYAFGNPISGRWTALMAIGDLYNVSRIVSDLELSKSQIPSLRMLLFSLDRAGGIDSVVTVLGGEALLATKYPGLLGGFQNPLPDNQWKEEVKYWFNIALAKLQLQLINIATGPPDTNLPGLVNILPAISAGQDDMVKFICGSQKIRNVEFKNYRSFGQITCMIIGGLLILATYIGRYICRVRNHEVAHYWTSYGTLELLAMAMKGGGIVGWKIRHGVPILDPGTLPAGDIKITSDRSQLIAADWSSNDLSEEELALV